MRYLSIIALLLTVTLTEAQVVPDSTRRSLYEHEAALFARPADSVVVRLLTEKAYLYRQLGNYRSAIRELERGVTFIRDSGQAQWKYEALLNYYMAGDFEKAAGLLERFGLAQAQQIGREKEYLFLRWGTFLELREWVKCKTEMLQFCDQKQLSACKTELAVLDTAVRYKDPEKARKLSAFLPGLGSMYAGYPLRGTVSLLVDGGLAGLTVVLAINELYVTSAASGLFPFLKFYRGNIKLSGNLAERKNTERELALRSQYYGIIGKLLK